MLILDFFNENREFSIRDAISQYIGGVDLDGKKSFSKFIVMRPVCAILRSARENNVKELNRKIAEIMEKENSIEKLFGKLQQLA